MGEMCRTHESFCGNTSYGKWSPKSETRAAKYDMECDDRNAKFLNGFQRQDFVKATMNFQVL